MGGMEQICAEAVEVFRASGHEVIVLTSHHGSERAPADEQGIVRTLHLQADVSHYRPADFFLRRNSQEAENLAELSRLIRDFHPDIILIWGMWNLSRALPALAEELMPEQVAYYMASYWAIDPDIHVGYWTQPASHPLTQLAFKPFQIFAQSQLQREGYPPKLAFRNVACVSQYVRETLVSSGKIPPSSKVILLGIHPEAFVRAGEARQPAANGRLRLLYFGSLLEQKGVHTAIEALGRLKQRGQLDNFHLTILGSGHPDYEARLRQRVVKLGLQEHVTMHGRVARDQVPSWLGQSDIFLFTSIWPEPMARSVMEAMAAGMLVIGTEVGGQSEMLVHGQNGLTFPADDAEMLADRIAQADSDPEAARRLADNGKQLILTDFVVTRYLDEMERWLQSLLAESD
jgi:glycogen(starch) synthase